MALAVPPMPRLQSPTHLRFDICNFLRSSFWNIDVDKHDDDTIYHVQCKATTIDPCREKVGLVWKIHPYSNVIVIEKRFALLRIVI